MPIRVPTSGIGDGPSGAGTQGSSGGTVTGSDVTTVVTSAETQVTIRDEGIASPEIAGNLGQRLITNQTADLVQRAYRANSSSNVQRSWNHRYRGQRESFKFNLLMQQVLALSAWSFTVLEPINRSLRTAEFRTGPQRSDTPTSSEYALIYHIRLQQDFKEWLLLRDADVKWFVN